MSADVMETHTPNPATPTISVAMATYQGARHIRQQLESIAQQTLLPYELVVTDDDSADATLAIVEEFARTAPFPVRIYKNETRLRYADNFLKAAALCQGDLIAFCDQDDIWMENKLKVCSRFFIDPAVLLVVHTAQTFTGTDTLGYYFPSFPTTRLLPCGVSNPFENRPGFAMVVRRQLLSVIDSLERPVALYSHDHWVWFLAATAGTIATVAEVLTRYRQHESNVYGASKDRTALGRLKVALEVPRYSDLADAELACAEVLSKVQANAPSGWAVTMQRSAQAMYFRSSLHRLRARVYADKTGLPARLHTFLTLCTKGAYQADPSQTRLGTRAAAKDLLLGVLGLSRVPIKGSTANS